MTEEKKSNGRKFWLLLLLLGLGGAVAVFAKSKKKEIELNKCKKVACLLKSHCDPETGLCIKDDLCKDIKCPEGQVCNTNTGLCNFPFVLNKVYCWATIDVFIFDFATNQPLGGVDIYVDTENFVPVQTDNNGNAILNVNKQVFLGELSANFGISGVKEGYLDSNVFQLKIDCGDIISLSFFMTEI